MAEDELGLDVVVWGSVFPDLRTPRLLLRSSFLLSGNEPFRFLPALVVGGCSKGELEFWLCFGSGVWLCFVWSSLSLFSFGHVLELKESPGGV